MKNVALPKRFLGVVAFWLANQVQAQPVDAPWPMIRNDRWGTAKQLVGPDPATNKLPWVERIIAPGEIVSHPPAIDSNGVLYFGSWLSFLLRKVDSNTGAVLGSFNALEWIKSSPALGNSGSAYINVPRTNGTIAGRLYSVNQTTMGNDWFFTTSQTSANNDYDNASPIIGPDGSILTGSTNNTVYRIAPNGTTVWDRTGIAAIKFSVCMTRDDTKVIVSNGPRVTALNYADGTTAWSVTLPSTCGSPGVAPNGTVVVGTDFGMVFALDPNTGTILWNFQTLSFVRGAPAFSDQNVYVGSFDARLYCLRATDGVMQWSVTTNQQIMQGPIVGSDGSIYSNGQNGEITKVSPNGQVVWQVNANRDCRGPMSMDDKGKLYLPTASNGGGVLKITQDIIETAPSNLVLNRGQVVSGGLNDLVNIDQSYYQVRNGAISGLFDPPIQFTMDAISPVLSVSQVEFRMVVAASTANLVQRIEAFNWNTNAFYVMDVSPTPTSDTPYNLTITNNIAKFVNAQGQMKFRVIYYPVGPTLGLRYQTRIDYAHFTIGPRFAP